MSNTGNWREPPHNKDLEKVVLGALILEAEAYYEVEDMLSIKLFYLQEHQYIFMAIQSLATSNSPIDLMTVYSQLKKQGDEKKAGGIVTVTEMVSMVNTTTHLGYHIRLLYDLAVRRNMIELGNYLVSNGYSEDRDISNVIEKTESRLLQLSELEFESDTSSAAELVTPTINSIRERIERRQYGGVTGITSGYPKIDELTGGWVAGQLAIVAARPGMGKSAFALSMARLMSVNHNIPVAIFSLEMTSKELMQRLIVSQSEVPNDDVKKGTLTSIQISSIEFASEVISRAPIYINDKAGISIQELRSELRRLVREYGVKVVVVDYIQLMTISGLRSNANREQEVSNISRNLKAIAKDLGVVVVALSQLNRSVENRSVKDKRPQLSDLRESGSIEQDADVVMFIHRPDYYGAKVDDSFMETENVAELIFRKQRNGDLGTVPLTFRGEFIRFDSVGEYPF